MNVSCTVIVAFFVCLLPTASNAWQSSFAEACISHRNEAKKTFDESTRQLKLALSIVKKGVVKKGAGADVNNGRLIYESKEEKQARIDFVQSMIDDSERMAKASAQQYPIPPLNVLRVSNGHIGYLYSQINVKQVVDANNFIGEIRVKRVSPQTGHESSQVVELWFQGIETDGLADDMLMRAFSGSDGIFEYAGGQQYRTVLGGTRTLPKLIVKSPDDLKKLIPEDGELLYLKNNQLKVMNSFD